MQIPWRLKSVVFGLVDHVGPAPLYYLQKHVTGRSSETIRAIPPAWAFHKTMLTRFGSKRVLEFGAGKNLAQNIYLSDLGLEQTAIDLNPMIDIDLVNQAIAQLADLGVATRGPVRDLGELAVKYRISYVAPADMRRTPWADGAYDAVISTNTLEHVPDADVALICREAKRLLSSGGIFSAKIDYSDHYAHTDRGISRLNYLRFSGSEWARHNHDCHYQNRLRHRHYIGHLEKSGFCIVYEEARSPCDNPGGLREENLTGSDTDFSTSGYLVARA